MSGTPPPINRALLFIKSHVYVILIKVSLLTFFSKKVSGCRASALIRGPRKAKAFWGKGATAQKAKLLSLAAKRAKGRVATRSSGRGRLCRRPAVCDARTLPKGRVQRCHPAVFCLLPQQKRKMGAHAVYSAVFRLCAARSGVFRLLGAQGVFCGCFGRGKVCRLILYSAVIYTQWV